MRLLPLPQFLLIFLRGRRIQPEPQENQPPHHRRPHARDPDICAADRETPRVFIMCHVSHGHRPLLVDVGEEGSLVVDAEVEDAVLVWKGERGGVESRVGSGEGGRRVQGETVERREHGAFELDGVGWGRGEWGEVVALPFGELDIVGLFFVSAWVYELYIEM